MKYMWSGNSIERKCKNVCKMQCSDCVVRVLSVSYSRAPNSHALTVRLAHFTPFHLNLTLSRTYGNISRNFFLLVRGLWCTKVPAPTMCLLCENGCQNFWGKKKKWWSFPPPPPPSISFFGTCATFIGCERTGLTYLTPNPHPKLAALGYRNEKSERVNGVV